MKKISLVIPVYNEEKRIGQVLKPCLEADFLNEVIVVNDGSTDKTLNVLKKFKEKITIIDLEKNQGKGFAVASGVKRAKGEIILLLDGDLTNLKTYHLFSLISPIVEQDVDMTIGAFVDFEKAYYPNWPFSGQRAIKKELLMPLLEEISQTKYGMEVVLNENFKTKKVVVVPLVGLSFVKKPDKQEDWLSSYFKMNFELLQSVFKYKSKSLSDKIINNYLKKYLLDDGK